MTFGDKAIVVGVALAAALAWPATYLSAGGTADRVEITGPQGRTSVALAQNRTLDVQGGVGVVSITIVGRTVRVTHATCPNQLCVRQGAISAPGTALVCAPNAVTVRIGGGGDGPDVVVR